MREFGNIIFFGQPTKYLNEAQCYRLHQRLEDAFQHLSALQQPDHPESQEHFEQCKKWRTKAERELNDIINDICTALGRTVMCEYTTKW